MGAKDPIKSQKGPHEPKIQISVTTKISSSCYTIEGPKSEFQGFLVKYFHRLFENFIKNEMKLEKYSSFIGFLWRVRRAVLAMG
jgi:hypothetical protein